MSKKKENVFYEIDRWIKSWDLFGHSLDFNYQKKQTHYTTLFGGLISICIQAFVGFVLVTRLYQMFNNSAP